MASNIKFKRSAVQNRVPTTAQLDLGELALNTYDGKLYTEINTGSAAVVEIGSKLSSLVVDGDNGSGGGDVTFHGTTAGKDLIWDYSANKLVLNDNTTLQFGSGWCWLSLNNDKLVVTKTANAANPLIDNLKPILGCDVWEHSYYIDYRNRRPEYLDKFVDNLIDWEFVESLLI